MKLLGFSAVVVQGKANYLNAHWLWGTYRITVGYCLN
jgi:hypothetical protein